MPAFEFSEDGSNKFWKIDLDGSSFTARWGKIGTKGQEKRQDFATADEAKREYEKLIASKLKKGYRRVDAAPAPAPPASGEPVLQNLDDPNAYLIYADWLQSKGDPRGELISIQHARLTNDTAELREREAQLLQGQGDALFGKLAPLLKKEGGVSVTWRLGFLHAVRIARDSWDATLDVGETLASVLELPIAAHLEWISIGLCQEPDGDGDFQEAIDVLVEGRKPQTLRSLFLGDFEFPDQSDISSTQVGDLTGLYEAFPSLRSLRLRGAGATLGKIALPELREFTFESGGLGVEAVESIAAARWPKLERLEVWFGDPNYGADATLESVEPILKGKGLGELRHLGLLNSSFLSGNVDALAKAKILPQLKSLDLSMGTLWDDDAEAFVRHAAAFKHLEQLVVSDNWFSRRGLWLLAKVVPNVVSKDQNAAASPADRYVAVGE